MLALVGIRRTHVKTGRYLITVICQLSSLMSFDEDVVRGGGTACSKGRNCLFLPRELTAPRKCAANED